MNLFRRDGTRKKVEQLIRDGVGVHERTWELPRGPHGLPGEHPLLEPITRWVRESMSAMRRPYGIDHVALALACRDSSGRVLVSNSFGVVRPATFYADEGARRIESFFDDVAAAEAGVPREIVGALLSLGDLAFELGEQKAA